MPDARVRPRLVHPGAGLSLAVGLDARQGECRQRARFDHPRRPLHVAERRRLAGVRSARRGPTTPDPRSLLDRGLGEDSFMTAPDTIETLANREYRYGFVTDIESDLAPRGLNEDTIRLISAKKNEPDFMLEWRLKAYRHWAKLAKAEAEPRWSNVRYPSIDYQDIIYYAAPKQKKALTSLDEVDPELVEAFEK